MLRVSTILMYVCLVAIVVYFIFVLYSMLDKGGSKLSYLKPATEQEVIPYSKLQSDSSTMEFTYSIWFYIDDWNYKYGKKKIIMTRDDEGGSPCPELALDSTENNVHITMNHYKGNTPNMNDSPTSSISSTSHTSPTSPPVPSKCPSTHPYSADDPLKIKQSGVGSTHCCKKKELMPGIHGTGNDCIKCESPPCTTYNIKLKEGFSEQTCLDGPDVGSGPGQSAVKQQAHSGHVPEHALSHSKESHSPCTITNVPLQEWVNIIISAKSRSVDVYLNGLLVNSCLLPGVIKNCPQAALKVTPDGGFKGWTSNLRYWSKSIFPSEARRIYDLGYAGSVFSSVKDKMRLKVSLMQGGTTESSFTI